MISSKKNITRYVFILFCSISWSQEYKRMMDDKSYTVQEVQKEAENYFLKNDKGKGSGYKQYKRWEFNSLRLMDEDGYLKQKQFYSNELKRHNKTTNQRKSAKTNDYWEELGPTYWNKLSGWNPGVGRLTSIAVEKSRTNHIIVGSDAGGVWKTTDEGKK